MSVSLPTSRLQLFEEVECFGSGVSAMPERESAITTSRPGPLHTTCGRLRRSSVRLPNGRASASLQELRQRLFQHPGECLS